MSAALTEQTDSGSALVALAGEPEVLIQRATRIAKALAKMIDQRQLYREIQGRRFVLCEGWTVCAAMNGVMPRELTVSEQDGVFTATVELVHLATGNVVGRASAECGAPDELDRKGQPLWSARPRYARRSMALTRATSKACRLTFSWIMALGGLEVTPAEEVPPDGFPEDRRAPRASQASQNGPVEAIWPFGTKKGTPLAQLSTEELRAALAWIRKRHKGEDLVQPILDLLTERMDQPLQSHGLGDLQTAGPTP